MALDLSDISMNEPKVILSTLWVVVLLNIIFADIVGYMNPGDLEKVISGDVGVKITQELLLVFSILLEIPIAMVILSRILKYKYNRWANIIAALITIAFVIGGGDTYLSYIFFASIEIGCLVIIIWYSWWWKEESVTFNEIT